MRNKTLTRTWLESQRIQVIDSKVYHQSKKCGLVELVPTIRDSKQKYCKGKSYGHIGWYDNQTHKQYSFLVHRVIYAWYYGIAQGNLDIDHMDGNSLNNDIRNLQIITHKDNLNRRHGNGHNNSIYYGMGNLSDKEVDALRAESKAIQTKKKEMVKVNKQINMAIKHHKSTLRDALDMYRYDTCNLEHNTIEYKNIRTKYLEQKESLMKQIKELQEMFHENVNNYRVKELEFRERLKCIRDMN